MVRVMLNMVFISDLHLLTVVHRVELSVKREVKSNKVDYITSKNILQMLKKAVELSAFTALHKTRGVVISIHAIRLILRRK